MKQALKSRYAVDVEGFMALNPEIDHHEIPARLAQEVSLFSEALNTEAVQAYVRQLADVAVRSLGDVIRSAV